ncbi:MAG: hypothetical protein PWP51_2961 [Clostridiales bacterium]|nr:hypothetical protein [Clostridiales bacterium]
MWTRVELKSRAKKYLRSNYLHAFLVSFIIMIVGGGLSQKPGVFKVNVDMGSPEMVSFASPLMVLGVVFAIGLFIAAVAFGIFVGAPLEVGGRKYYIRAAEGEPSKLEHVTSIFSSGGYKNVVITMLYKNVIVLLWFLALVIPGIIKSYAYRMVPYILAENPHMDRRDALRLSEEMTYTHKFNMFVLDLSFIGWFILGGLFFGIGTWFVNPYADATMGQLYQVLKREIIAENLASEDEFDDPDDMPYEQNTYRTFSDRDESKDETFEDRYK